MNVDNADTADVNLSLIDIFHIYRTARATLGLESRNSSNAVTADNEDAKILLFSSGMEVH